MKGEWLLVRMKPRGGEKRENWLLRKVQDRHAGDGNALVERELTSVVTGRTMAEIAAGTVAQRSVGTKSKRKGKPPTFRSPQLATLVNTVPTGNDWLHEIKFDGYRTLIAAAGRSVKVFTRNGHDWTDKFTPLAQAVAQLDLPSCLIDGEIVAYGKDGNPSFSALQAVLKRGHGAQGAGDQLELHAFDLLEQDGQDFAPMPNIERKERLEALLHNAVPPVRVAEHLIGVGEKLLAAMCGSGQEGIISKRADAPYRGARSKSWLKVKCTNRQEFVVVGWTPSASRRRAFASLLLAQWENAHAHLQGQGRHGVRRGCACGSGAEGGQAGAQDCASRCSSAEARKVQWVTPKLVAEVAFAEFTADGRVRHGSFIGLRADKSAAEVTPELRKAVPRAASLVDISSRERVIFPGSGETKGDLANYYAAASTLMLPFGGGRPISLVRCPQGRAKKCFFQKHDSGGFGAGVHHVPILEKNGGSEDYLYVEDATGLLQCVQMGTIEFHAWASTADAVEQPDRMVFDLDPDEGLDFKDVKRAAKDIRLRLADLGLVSFAMLSGGKGIHVLVPLAPGHSWEDHKDFARRFAEALAMSEPERFVATMSKAKRKGRIFIDWLRNQRGATAIVPYSARSRDGAPVAAPIAWEELTGLKNAQRWSIRDTQILIERATGTDLRGWGFSQQILPPF
ncbi:DNA ligase D [Novosphingobium fluoreni]|uniref:DNA ligase D n=1 Tax=Novosphingobium fluoreni TaxID=1391222 RepID=UPI003DA0C51E